MSQTFLIALNPISNANRSSKNQSLPPLPFINDSDLSQSDTKWLCIGHKRSCNVKFSVSPERWTVVNERAVWYYQRIEENFHGKFTLMQQKRTINCMHSKNNCFENPASQCRRLQILIYKKYMQKKHSKFIIINNIKNMNLSNLKGVLPKGRFFIFLGNFFFIWGRFFFFWENFPFFWGNFSFFWEIFLWEIFLFFWENFPCFWENFSFFWETVFWENFSFFWERF